MCDVNRPDSIEMTNHIQRRMICSERYNGMCGGNSKPHILVSYSHNYTSTNLHLRVDDAGVLALAVDVVDLGHKVVVPQVRVHDVVHVHREDVEET